MSVAVKAAATTAVTTTNRGLLQKGTAVRATGKVDSSVAVKAAATTAVTMTNRRRLQKKEQQ